MVLINKNVNFMFYNSCKMNECIKLIIFAYYFFSVLIEG